MESKKFNFQRLIFISEIKFLFNLFIHFVFIYCCRWLTAQAFMCSARSSITRTSLLSRVMKAKLQILRDPLTSSSWGFSHTERSAIIKHMQTNFQVQEYSTDQFTGFRAKNLRLCTRTLRFPLLKLNQSWIRFLHVKMFVDSSRFFDFDQGRRSRPGASCFFVSSFFAKL